MSIHYACVKPTDRAAIEHSVRGGAYASQTQKILAKLSENQKTSSTADRKASYSAESVNFHVLTVAGGTIFLCIADTTYRQGLAFEFLAKLKEAYPGKSERETTVMLRQFTDKYNSPEADKLKKLQNEIGQVRDIMLQNLDDVIQRGENIDNVVDKTQDLVYEADEFHASSRSLHRAMWLKNLKLIALIIGVVLLLCLIISMFACGITFEKCRSKKEESKTNSTNNAFATDAVVNTEATPFQIESTEAPPRPMFDKAGPLLGKLVHNQH